jgi:hypothetical protein
MKLRFAVTSSDHDHIIARTAVSKQAAMRTNFRSQFDNNQPRNFAIQKSKMTLLCGFFNPVILTKPLLTA